MIVKPCSKCGVDKPLDAYWSSPKDSHGRASACIECSCRLRKERYENDPEYRARTAEQRRRTYQATKAQARERNFRRKYGITSAVYAEMLAAQDGVCAACGEPESVVINGTPRRLAVDHDHDTGNVRALLCGACNRALGMAGESPDRLRRLAAYIEFHQSAQRAGAGRSTRPEGAGK